jgi:Phage terminase large subunit (GpA)
MLTAQKPKIVIPSQRQWFWNLSASLIPQELEEVVEWADKYYKVLTNDRDLFCTEESPWLIEPLQMADDPLVSRLIYVKPVQCGAGTSLTEIILMRRILDSSGLLCYYWPTDDKAKDRWEKWTERRMRACVPVRARMPREYENMLIKFPNITFSMCGVFNDSNLTSDTVETVIGDEVHLWPAGAVPKANGRQTLVQFPKFILASNAGIEGDQLHQESEQGTKQVRENWCPGCGKFHFMQTHFDSHRPDLGGLCYDTDGCKMDNATFDYNKLLPTIYFQFPCGYKMRDDITERRKSSKQGRYSEPQNKGALLINRSYSLQAVSCHTVRWLDLIKEKHTALRNLRAGDDTAWRVYLQERECIFYNPNKHRPFQGQIVVTSGAVKTRDGLPGEVGKIFSWDWQQGYKHLGELTHYWGVIESVLPDCNSQALWAGKADDEAELLAVLKDHGITEADGGGICDGFIDASKNTKNILSFCFRAGINAVMGNVSGKGQWRWPDDSRQYFSPKKFIYKELNLTEPKYPLIPTSEGYIEDPAEPYIILYSKAGILKNHFFIREMKANVLANNKDATPADYIERIVPSDIGEDYLKHHEAWERDFSATAPKKMGDIEGFKKVAKADHLMSCTCYIDLMKDLTGLLGQAIERIGLKR